VKIPTGQKLAERVLEYFHAEIVAQGRNPEDVDQRTSLYRYGILDSIGLLRLVDFLEQEFQIEIGDDDMVPENFGTAEAIGVFVASKLTETINTPSDQRIESS
jgi:acyl carrier protein